MDFNNSDSLLILSILNCEKDNLGADIIDIIAYSDYTNHAIMTFDEFRNGLAKFLSIGLIQINSDKLKTNSEFKDWYISKNKTKKRIYPLTEVDNILKYLVRRYPSLDNDLKSIDILITKDAFDNSVIRYLDKMKKIQLK